MGDYYQEVDVDQLPVLYSTVKADFNFPAVDYEIVKELIVSPYETSLIAEAFRLTGNVYISPFVDNDDDDDVAENGFAGDCQPGCPSFPCCLSGLVECNDDFLPNPDDCPFYDVGCFESSNTLNEYLACVDAITSNVFNPYTTNSCGCEVYKDTRRPGGCVNVEDTQLGMQGVRSVKVIMWDKWITDHHTTYTDDNGCWKINNRFYGKAWMWVKFENARGRVRGIAQNWKLWQLMTTVKDYRGIQNGPYFNDITVNYMDVLDNSSKAHRFWSAATVNNALHEFYDNAILDGISTPAPNLDIYIARNSTRGFALMSHHIEAEGVGLLIGKGLFNSSYFSDIGVGLIGQFVGSLFGGTLAAHYEAALPDVMIGTNFATSDNLKALAFHEFAHTSHFQIVGTNYWVALGSAEIAANGWGDGTEPDAGRVQVAESWAEHIGDTYTDRIYELNHSNAINPGQTNTNRWINLLERDLFDAGHVPVAIFHDLIDDNSSSIVGSTENNAVTNDGNTIAGGVTGYTNAIMFSVLTSSTTNPTILREELKTVLPSGVTTANIDALFSDYGY